MRALQTSSLGETVTYFSKSIFLEVGKNQGGSSGRSLEAGDPLFTSLSNVITTA